MLNFLGLDIGSAAKAFGDVFRQAPRRAARAAAGRLSPRDRRDAPQAAPPALPEPRPLVRDTAIYLGAGAVLGAATAILLKR